MLRFLNFLCATAFFATFGLAPGQAQAASCGGSGQKPCALFSSDFMRIGNFCEDGLDHIPWVVCAPKIEDDAFEDKVGELAGLIAEIYIAFNITSGATTNLIAILEATGAESPEELQRIIEEDPRFDRVYALTRALGMNTLTVGLAGGGSLIGGGGVESGVSLDVNKSNVAYGYFSSYTSIGLQLGFGADLVVSGFLSDNICIEDGTAIGTSVYVDAGPGGGVVIWHGENGDFAGFSVPVGLAGVGFGIASLRAETDVLLAECDVTGQPVPGPIIVPPPGSIPQPSEPERHLVEAGDSLWRIALANYEDGQAYPLIFAANDDILTNPDLIFPGQSLIVPARP